VTELDIGIQIC